MIMRGDWGEADLDSADQAMLAYIEKLTLKPLAIGPRDINSLREYGFSDRAICDIALQASLFSFFNRVVDGLGNSLDASMAEEARRLRYPLHPGTYEHLEEESTRRALRQAQDRPVEARRCKQRQISKSRIDFREVLGFPEFRPSRTHVAKR